MQGIRAAIFFIPGESLFCWGNGKNPHRRPVDQIGQALRSGERCACPCSFNTEGTPAPTAGSDAASTVFHLPTTTQPTFFCAAPFRGFVLGLDAASVIKVDAPVEPVSVEFLAERTATFAEGFALRGGLLRLVGRQRGAG